MKRIAFSAALVLGLGIWAGPGFAQERKEVKKEEKRDAFDKAGDATEGALEKAGDGAETGLDATGKGLGAAVEHTGRGAVKGAKATAKGAEKVGEAVAGVFTDDEPDQDRALAAQRALQAKGYYGGPIDGIIGSKTRAGLREFQQDQGLDVNGKLNDDTAEKLGID